MSFFDYLKDYFGFSGHRNFNNDQQEEKASRHHEYTDRCRFWNESARPSSFWNDMDESVFFNEPSPDQMPRDSNIIRDPMEMHKFFEHQVLEMLKSFGLHDHDDESFVSNFFSWPSLEKHSHMQAIGEREVPKSSDLRGYYLKPGYDKPTTSHSKEDKVDKDVDGKLNMGDLDSVLRGKQPSEPYQSTGGMKLFGHSVSTRTIKHPDGTVETHKTVKDSNGNEEITITRRIGDKEHTITKRRNRNGEEESIENLVNIDEKDLGVFQPKTDEPPDNPKSPNWFPFEQFF